MKKKKPQKQKKQRHWSAVLGKLCACPTARRWARRQPSYAVAWKRCTRPGWLAFLLEAGKCWTERYWELIGAERGQSVSLLETREDKAYCDLLRKLHPRPSLKALVGD